MPERDMAVKEGDEQEAKEVEKQPMQAGGGSAFFHRIIKIPLLIEFGAGDK